MREFICIVCPNGCRLRVSDDGALVEGATCQRGVAYGRKETVRPTRVVTSTVRIQGALHPRLPVKTDRDIDKTLVRSAVALLNRVEVRHPVRCGDVIVSNVCDTGANFVATRDL